MKRLLMISGALVLLAAVAGSAAVAVVLNSGKMLHRAINTYGPGVLKTEVRLGSVDLHILAARATLTDLYIGNPGGFTSAKLFSAQSIAVGLDRLSLLSGPLIIDRLEIDSPEIFYEKKGRTDNFKALLQNMALSGPTGPAEPTGTAGSQASRPEAKKLIIRELVIHRAKVTAGIRLFGGKSISVVLPELRLQEIGGSSGALPAEVARQVLAGVYEMILANSGLINKVFRAAGISTEHAGDGIKKSFEKAAGSIKKLFGN